MEVILREHVENLGRRGDVVKVADGYARNYLLPRQLALPATEANRKVIERQRHILEAKEVEERTTAQRLAERLRSLECVMARKVGETEQLFGSVTASDLTEWLALQGFAIDKRRIQLHEPIKQLGEFDVPIKIHRDVTATLKVNVVKEETRE